MNIKSIIFVAIVGLVAVFTSGCDNEPDIFYPTTKDFCGEWIVSLENQEDPSEIYSGYTILTYNTSANDNTIWFQDDDLFGTKLLLTADLNSGIFKGDNSDLEEQGLSVTQGQIFKNAIKVKPQELMGDAIVVDSIDIKIDCLEDDGSTSHYRYHGYRRTGWEDYVE